MTGISTATRELVHGTEVAQRRLDAVRLRALEGFAGGHHALHDRERTLQDSVRRPLV